MLHSNQKDHVTHPVSSRDSSGVDYSYDVSTDPDSRVFRISKMKMNSAKPNGGCATAESLLPANGKQLLSARNLEQLLEAEGFGLFHVALLVFTAIGYAGCTMTSFSIPWVLPAADVELGLTSVQKGWINAVSTLGKGFGNSVIGAFSDSLGRKRVILFCFFLMAMSVVLASMSIHFIMLLILSFSSGLR